MSLSEVLTEIESRGPKSPHEVLAALGRAREKDALRDAPDGELRAEFVAFQVLPGRAGELSSWGTYYGPLMSAEDSSGRISTVPPVESIDAATIEYWRKRAHESADPLMRARYGDLVWDLAKPMANMRPDPECARIAIDAVLTASASDNHEHPTRALDHLAHALSLALSLNDEARIAHVRDALIAFEDKHAEDSKPGTWGRAFDWLVGQKEKVRLSAGAENAIVQSLESRLARLSATESPTCDPFDAEHAARRLATYYRAKEQGGDVSRVLGRYRDALKHMATGAKPLLAAQWLGQVFDLYKAFGLHDEADALVPELSELERRSIGDLKPMSVEVEIPTTELDSAIASVMHESLDATLDTVAGAFVIDKVQAAAEVKRLAAAAPLMALLPQTYLDSEGRPEAVIGSVEDDLDGRTVRQMADSIFLMSFWLRRTLLEVQRRFAPTAEELCAYLFRAPVFHEPQRGIVRRGVEAYMQGDYVAACHILVPQIEQAVRRLVVAAGGSHLSRRRGTQELRTLDALLNDPVTAEVFGPSVVGYLTVLLTDRRGVNARNAVCHGWLPAQAFNSTLADRLMHALLILAQVRVKPAQSGDPQGPRPPGPAAS